MTVSEVVEHDELATFLEPSAAVEVGHSMKCLILQGWNTSTTPVKIKISLDEFETFYRVCFHLRVLCS